MANLKIWMAKKVKENQAFSTLNAMARISKKQNEIEQFTDEVNSMKSVIALVRFGSV